MNWIITPKDKYTIQEAENLRHGILSSHKGFKHKLPLGIYMQNRNITPVAKTMKGLKLLQESK